MIIQEKNIEKTEGSLAYRLQMKEMELNTLFETIQAINDNASEEHLYKIYQLTLRSRKYISKLALFVFDEEEVKWECKAYFGLKSKGGVSHTLPISITKITKTTDRSLLVGGNQDSDEHDFFHQFQAVIPVKHKKDILAYVLITAEDGKNLQDIDFIEALSNIIIVAVENKKLARKQSRQEIIKRQLEIAKDVQTLLFPKKLPYNERLKVMASYQPHHTVGGDYYDFIEIDKNRFMLCIADVSGKGVPAAILMSNFQAALRILVRKKIPLKEIIEELNYLIMQNARGENFITAFFMEYDFMTHSLSYVNAGHNPPFLFVNNDPTFLEEGTTILGGFDKLPLLDITNLQVDDFLLFCFTDGFTETYNENGEEFGVQLMEDFIKEHIQLDQKALHIKLLDYLNTFKGNNAYADDITLLSCKVINS
ncbi:MAG: PP2C family protein-serine/threonine phosphatase [Thermoflexibacter sp.]|jgi:sigma-B regulation protein RsbU (phosphoserine phosphatase)|nr:PP2C family protein-serine/threonine phosphatase [Thermoflexibacter sp.]